MIVKRVSVPIGLEELMEGLTKEVLLKKPKDLYMFASEYFSRLVHLREQTHFHHKVRRAQSVTQLKPSVLAKEPKPRPKPAKPNLSRQMSVRGKSPTAPKTNQTPRKRSTTIPEGQPLSETKINPNKQKKVIKVDILKKPGESKLDSDVLEASTNVAQVEQKINKKKSEKKLSGPVVPKKSVCINQALDSSKHLQGVQEEGILKQCAIAQDASDEGSNNMDKASEVLKQSGTVQDSLVETGEDADKKGGPMTIKANKEPETQKVASELKVETETSVDKKDAIKVLQEEGRSGEEPEVLKQSNDASESSVDKKGQEVSSNTTLEENGNSNQKINGEPGALRQSTTSQDAQTTVEVDKKLRASNKAVDKEPEIPKQSTIPQTSSVDKKSLGVSSETLQGTVSSSNEEIDKESGSPKQFTVVRDPLVETESNVDEKGADDSSKKLQEKERSNDKEVEEKPEILKQSTISQNSQKNEASVDGASASKDSPKTLQEKERSIDKTNNEKPETPKQSIIPQGSLVETESNVEKVDKKGLDSSSQQEEARSIDNAANDKPETQSIILRNSLVEIESNVDKKGAEDSLKKLEEEERSIDKAPNEERETPKQSIISQGSLVESESHVAKKGPENSSKNLQKEKRSNGKAMEKKTEVLKQSTVLQNSPKNEASVDNVDEQASKESPKTLKEEERSIDNNEEPETPKQSTIVQDSLDESELNVDKKEPDDSLTNAEEKERNNDKAVEEKTEVLKQSTVLQNSLKNEVSVDNVDQKASKDSSKTLQEEERSIDKETNEKPESLKQSAIIQDPLVESVSNVDKKVPEFSSMQEEARSIDEASNEKPETPKQSIVTQGSSVETESRRPEDSSKKLHEEERSNDKAIEEKPEILKQSTTLQSFKQSATNVENVDEDASKDSPKTLKEKERSIDKATNEEPETPKQSNIVQDSSVEPEDSSKKLQEEKRRNDKETAEKPVILKQSTTLQNSQQTEGSNDGVDEKRSEDSVKKLQEEKRRNDKEMEEKPEILKQSTIPQNSQQTEANVDGQASKESAKKPQEKVRNIDKGTNKEPEIPKQSTVVQDDSSPKTVQREESSDKKPENPKQSTIHQDSLVEKVDKQQEPIFSKTLQEESNSSKETDKEPEIPKQSTIVPDSSVEAKSNVEKVDKPESKDNQTNQDETPEVPKQLNNLQVSLLHKQHSTDDAEETQGIMKSNDKELIDEKPEAPKKSTTTPQDSLIQEAVRNNDKALDQKSEIPKQSIIPQDSLLETKASVDTREPIAPKTLDKDSEILKQTTTPQDPSVKTEVSVENLNKETGPELLKQTIKLHDSVEDSQKPSQGDHKNPPTTSHQGSFKDPTESPNEKNTAVPNMFQEGSLVTSEAKDSGFNTPQASLDPSSCSSEVANEPKNQLESEQEPGREESSKETNFKSRVADHGSPTEPKETSRNQFFRENQKLVPETGELDQKVVKPLDSSAPKPIDLEALKKDIELHLANKENIPEPLSDDKKIPSKVFSSVKDLLDFDSHKTLMESKRFSSSDKDSNSLKLIIVNGGSSEEAERTKRSNTEEEVKSLEEDDEGDEMRQGISKEDTFVKEEPQQRRPKLGDIEQVASVIEVVKPELTSMKSVKDFLENEQNHVYVAEKTKKPSKILKYKPERSLSQSSLKTPTSSLDRDDNNKVRRARSVGVPKTKETRSRIPTPRRSAGRRPLVRQLEADSKELEEKLNGKNSTGSSSEDVLIAKRILEGVEGAKEHLEGIEQKSVRKTKEEDAARTIQSAWRAREVLKKQRNKEEEAAIKLQALVRGFLERHRHQKRTLSKTIKNVDPSVATKPDFYRSDTVNEPEAIKESASTVGKPSKDSNNNCSKQETPLEKEVRATVEGILKTTAKKTPLEADIGNAIKAIMENNSTSVDLKSPHRSTSSQETAQDDQSSVGSMDSVVTVVLKPKHPPHTSQQEPPNQPKKLSSKALSTSAIEDHVDLIDQVQNSLLDQLSGKPIDEKNKFDIEQLRKELHDAATMYKDEDTSTTVDGYLYDFDPEDGREEEGERDRMVRTPLRNLPDIAEEAESKEEDGEKRSHQEESLKGESKNSSPGGQEHSYGTSGGSPAGVALIEPAVDGSEGKEGCCNGALKVDDKNEESDVKERDVKGISDGKSSKEQGDANDSSKSAILSTADSVQTEKGIVESDSKESQKLLHDTVSIPKLTQQSLNEQNKLLHSSELHDSMIIPQLTQQSLDKTNQGVNHQKLLHSSEFHDSVIISELTRQSMDNNEQPNMPNKEAEQSTTVKTNDQDKLLHSTEVYDSVIVPKVIQPSVDKIEQGGNHQKLLHFSEFHDSVIIPELTQQSLNNNEQIDISNKEILQDHHELLHSNKLHDSMISPKLTQKSLDKTNEPQEHKLLHSSELHDSVIIPELTRQSVGNNKPLNMSNNEILHDHHELLHSNELRDSMIISAQESLDKTNEEDKLLHSSQLHDGALKVDDKKPNEESDGKEKDVKGISDGKNSKEQGEANDSSKAAILSTADSVQTEKGIVESESKESQKLLHSSELHDSLIIPELTQQSLNEQKKLLHSNELHDSVIIPAQESLDKTNEQDKLLHSSERHDSVIIPELTQQSLDNNEQLNMSNKEILQDHQKLLHSSELHDSVIIPEITQRSQNKPNEGNHEVPTRFSNENHTKPSDIDSENKNKLLVEPEHKNGVTDKTSTVEGLKHNELIHSSEFHDSIPAPMLTQAVLGELEAGKNVENVPHGSSVEKTPKTVESEQLHDSEVDKGYKKEASLVNAKYPEKNDSLESKASSEALGPECKDLSDTKEVKSQNLLHSSELHDTVLIPGLTEELQESSDKVHEDKPKLPSSELLSMPEGSFNVIKPGDKAEEDSVVQEVIKRVVSSELQVENEKTATETNDGDHQKLLHSRELRDNPPKVPDSSDITVETSKPPEIPHNSDLLTKDHRVLDSKTLKPSDLNVNDNKIETLHLKSFTGLRHSGEFHDALVVPLARGANVMISNGTAEETGGAPQDPGVESVDVTSRRPASDREGVATDGAQASLKDARRSSRVEHPDSQSSESRAIERRGMESGYNNNNNKRNNAIISSTTVEKNMEQEAATKIQAGFRGYQVRKQLKAKNASTVDQKRQLRKRSSRENMKDPAKDLEEKSAVKIQAGVRGFLVRRRQKKTVNSSASA
ncbi:titin-like isoform X2 [Anthonomus grandis grandis]|uniref:titin-like isoform X2 n=1 Tax=Anthonomus grandis grandis TaxID=2921223 RepID=UPI0021661A18|nr:titin-like isoform X2 [Anthonomus grandis grandis]